MSLNVRDIDSLRAACTIDPATMCWLWNGGVARDGLPRIYTVDVATGAKCAISGPRAAWMVAHGEAPPPGNLIYRCCHRIACVNPAHLRRATSKAEIFKSIRLSRAWVGTNVEIRRAAVKKAWAAQGKTITSEATVRAIRQAPADVMGIDLARQHGVSPQVVSAIRTGKSFQWLT